MGGAAPKLAGGSSRDRRWPADRLIPIPAASSEEDHTTSRSSLSPPLGGVMITGALDAPGSRRWRNGTPGEMASIVLDQPDRDEGELARAQIEASATIVRDFARRIIRGSFAKSSPDRPTFSTTHPH
jgi:hypothetical protein